MKKMKHTILVVDDDRGHRNMLKTLLKKWGYDISEADDGATAIDRVKGSAFDLILMDVRMVKVSGIEALGEIKNINPSIPVIIMTAFSSIESAVEAIKKGAYDYLTKPFDFEKLKIIIERALDHTLLKKENIILKENLALNFDRENFIGNSPEVTHLLESVAQAAPTDATVLITGESGTGKELIAGALHVNSTRKEGPYIKINCAAITETLLESELFGHEKGAFTGADKYKQGRFQQADGGSLFLDEIGETSLAMQVKLLRAIQEREITPVGSEKVLNVDVRIIAATNKNLLDLIQEERFREDLYYRLNVVNLHIPSLRERKGDIPLLAEHFLKRISEKNDKRMAGFTPEAMNLLIHHTWPGNVRELINTIERSIIFAKSDYIGPNDLPFANSSLSDSSSEEQHEPNQGESVPSEKEESLYEIEKKAILRTLENAGGNKSETARRLGITRRTLHLKLKEYGVMP